MRSFALAQLCPAVPQVWLPASRPAAARALAQRAIVVTATQRSLAELARPAAYPPAADETLRGRLAARQLSIEEPPSPASPPGMAPAWVWKWSLAGPPVGSSFRAGGNSAARAGQLNRSPAYLSLPARSCSGH